MFARFWDRYECVNPDHPLFYEKSWEQRMHCIPVAVHGDEGRGLGKHPVLVESYQPILPWSGEDKLNMVGHLSMISSSGQICDNYVIDDYTETRILNHIATKAFLYN